MRSRVCTESSESTGALAKSHTRTVASAEQDARSEACRDHFAWNTTPACPSSRCSMLVDSASHTYTTPSSEPPTTVYCCGPKSARTKFLDVFKWPLKLLDRRDVRTSHSLLRLSLVLAKRRVP